MATIKALVYVRDYFLKSYLPVFQDLPGVDVSYVTDFPRDGMSNIRDRFYFYLNARSSPYDVPYDTENIIARCRLLRNLPADLARSMIVAMFKTVEELIDRLECDVVVGQMVDDYITHLFSLVAERKGLNYIGLCEGYFPHTTQITRHSDGGPIGIRNVPPAEAKNALESVMPRNFVQNYQQPNRYTFANHSARVLRYRAKLVAFKILKFYRRDPRNLHYTIQPYVAQRTRLRDYVTDTHFEANWRDLLSKNHTQPVYLPLAFFPEASTDYWVENRRFIDYERTILSLTRRLAKDRPVLVKEHVHMLGIRSRCFYNEIRTIENVALLPAQENSNRLLEEFKPIICVGGGSVGLEGTLRGIAVTTYCQSSYWCGPSGASVSDGSDEDLADKVNKVVAPSVDQLEFVSQCLQTMLPFNYVQDDSEAIAEHRETIIPFLSLTGKVR